MSSYDLLLLGAGHAHLGVLRRWALVERPPGRIALVSAGPAAWYSGMLPGLLAGRFQAEDCRVELQPLCRAAKVELIDAQVTALEADSHQVHLADGRTLEARWLSLNVGGQVSPPAHSGEGLELLAVKPFDAFVQGWSRWQQASQPLAILGGGAAGVELALALVDRVPGVSLFCAGPLLAGLNPGLRLRALGHLCQRGVRVREHCPIDRCEDDALYSGSLCVWRGPRLLLASGAQAWPWLASSGLRCDERGFVEIGRTLQSHSHPALFAVGDCASLPGAAKSGVYAVRQGPVLAANLSAVLRGLPLRRYRPQRHSLALLATGDGGALLGWRTWSAGGPLCGRWKDWLDRGFIQRHRLPE
ncbi:NADH dehydrogenase, FAD-containing subunit [Pseudomonas cuatrocienegasensis]|uniref:NADH dehydrogenase, FAD-containing subunit n=1 Tax=Pseudomonas cuatrocienegasensis TaxID=543360 RepID=A0ABY1BQE5_9PSED|nr:MULTISPECIES: FAD-dependent oxidoreductase [Pseudomonas]OEC33150.1 pyridine nucleotide-disulfide oxidoreductase [Pseudomonas sp. 21C1]SER37145.1 NADH dehydrogenase, FAD-containing subunit [Pseudomonas cuatrocienegasensis]